MSDETTIFIGRKPPMSYVTAILTAFNAEGVDQLVLKARGRSISTAVDVAEITRRRFLSDIETSKIEIGTEQLPNSTGGTRGVSTIAITVDRTSLVEAKTVEKKQEHTLVLSEIKGVGKATEEKLRKAGYDTVDSIASAEPEALAEKTGVSSKVAVKLVESAKALAT